MFSLSHYPRPRSSSAYLIISLFLSITTLTNHNAALLTACLEPIKSPLQALLPSYRHNSPSHPTVSQMPVLGTQHSRAVPSHTGTHTKPDNPLSRSSNRSIPLQFVHSLRPVYYSKSPTVSKLRLSLAQLNPSTGNNGLYSKKGGILIRSRCRDGPVVAGAAIVMHYCKSTNFLDCDEQRFASAWMF